MNSHVLRCRMKVFRPIEETFAVFQEPRNLARITPSWLGFQVLNQGPIEMRKGAEIDYRIKWLGLPLRWKTVITAYQPPYRFSDLQARGPYTLWHHLHTFESAGADTIVGDEVVYALPLGPLGDIAHALMVKRQLTGIFRFRQQALASLVGKYEVIEQPNVSPGERLSEQHLAHYRSYQSH